MPDDIELEAPALATWPELDWSRLLAPLWLTIRALGTEPEGGPFATRLRALVSARLRDPGTRTTLLATLDAEAFDARYPGVLALCDGVPRWRLYASCAPNRLSLVEPEAETAR